MTVWCLFSVANDYDQPEHNLSTLWLEKPSLEVLAKHMTLPLANANTSSEEIALVVDLWRGERVRFSKHGDTEYRLEPVEPSKVA